MINFFSAAGGRRSPSLTPQIHPRVLLKRPRIDPKACLCFGFPTPESPVLRFSEPRGTLSLVFRKLY